jgi:protein phosphatase
VRHRPLFVVARRSDGPGTAGARIIRLMPASSRPTLSLPEPCLVLLVGAAGSGKSTFAARHFTADEILSSDAYREAIAGDPSDQSRNRVVFEALHRDVEHRLVEGRTTLVDATNVERNARRALLRLATHADRPAVAIVLDVPLAVAQDRNARRGDRTVPSDVVARQQARLERTIGSGTLEREGFSAVHVLRGPAAIDAARVVRVSRSARDQGGDPRRARSGPDVDPGR